MDEQNVEVSLRKHFLRFEAERYELVDIYLLNLRNFIGDILSSDLDVGSKFISDFELLCIHADIWEFHWE